MIAGQTEIVVAISPLDENDALITSLSFDTNDAGIVVWSSEQGILTSPSGYTIASQTVSGVGIVVTVTLDAQAVAGELFALTLPVVVDSVTQNFYYQLRAGAAGTEVVITEETAQDIAEAIESELNTDLQTIMSLLASGNVHEQVAVANDGTVILYNSRTYGGSSHEAITFSVSKDYTSSTSLEFAIWTLGDPDTVLQRITATAASATSITASGTINVTGDYAGEFPVLACGYTLTANWSGSYETISVGRCYVYGQPS